MSGSIREVSAHPETAGVVPVIPLRPPVKGDCLCGGPLGANGDFVICEHCNRPYCPDCGGPIVHGGGCQSCVVCGYGYCA